MFKTSGILLAALLLAACGAPEPRSRIEQGAPGTGPGAGSTPAASKEPVSGAPAAVANYRIDPAQSELRLLVYRAGPMARLGHNHVIVNRSLNGWVNLMGSVTAGSVSISVPVALFIVDDAHSRSEAGPDFTEDVPEDAKAGTRRNMLGDGLLDAEHYPTITMTSIAVAQAQGAFTATLLVNVAGHQSTLVVPFALESSLGRLAASGSIMVRQTTLGLKPFSVMLGALQVEDELAVRFNIVAVSR